MVMSIAHIPRTDILFGGLTTSEGNSTGTTLICSSLIQNVDFVRQRTLILPKGNYYITAFNKTTGQVSFTPAYPDGQVKAGLQFFIIGGSGSGGSWMAEDADELYSAMPAGVATFQSAWYDFRNLKRCLIDIVSTLDQAVVIQPVGNISEDFTTAKNIGSPLNCPQGSITTSGLSIGFGSNDDWFPYIAIVITTTVACAAGTLTITGIGQS